MQKEVIWSWIWEKITYGFRNLTLGLNILLKNKKIHVRINFFTTKIEIETGPN